MITEATRKKYIPTIGIECHVQLKTKTKLFVGVDNDARDKEPNTTVSDICFGLPGTLPILNKGAVELGIRAGLALNAEINPRISFDRKHYFYPDLPLGYQITQMYEPIILGGYVDISAVLGSDKKVQIHHAHLEADAGKSTHPNGKEYSLVDFNRAGTPLLEIVSEPDMHSAKEAKAYAQELQLIMKYAEISEANLFYGNMRFDVNVSVAQTGSDDLGTRAEVKNLNSFKSVERAALYEINRQIEILEKGKSVEQETRGWDDAKQRTSSQRGKENAHDYRYMPEPDIPPVVITQEDIASQRIQMKKLPHEIRQELLASGLHPDSIETLLGQPLLLKVLTSVDSQDKKAIKKIANWLSIDVQGALASEDEVIEVVTLTGEQLLELYGLVSENKLSSTGAKDVLLRMLSNTASSLELAEEMGLLQESDETALVAMVNVVIAQNPQAVVDVQAGESKAIGFLVGQVMKESKGSANPGIVQKIIRDKLNQK